MPLLKKAVQPTQQQVAAEVVTQTIAEAQKVVENLTDAKGINPRLKDLDTTAKKILLQGSFQAALHSMGAVQFGGKTYATYLERVREAAIANVNFVLENM